MCYILIQKEVCDASVSPDMQNTVIVVFHEATQLVVFTFMGIIAETVLKSVLQNEDSLTFQAKLLDKQEADIQKSVTLVQCMRTVVDSFCDVVVELDRNLRILGAGMKQLAFFNQETNGKLFGDLLAGDDKTRWATFVAQTVASQIPGCLQITLSHEASISEVSVLLVPTCQERHFLGISIQQTEGNLESSHPDFLDTFHLKEDTPEAWHACHGDVGWHDETADSVSVANLKLLPDDHLDDRASVATFKTTPSVLAAHSASSTWHEMQIISLGFGSYTKIRMLGSGSFGKVYLVTNETGQLTGVIMEA